MWYKFPYNENFVVAICKKGCGRNGNLIINFAWPNTANLFDVFWLCITIFHIACCFYYIPYRKELEAVGFAIARNKSANIVRSNLSSNNPNNYNCVIS